MPKTYVVEKVIGRRTIDDNVQYLIKWKGYKTSTWEDARNCDCNYLIQQFELKTIEKQKREVLSKFGLPIQKRASRAVKKEPSETESAATSRKLPLNDNEKTEEETTKEITVDATASSSAGDTEKSSETENLPHSLSSEVSTSSSSVVPSSTSQASVVPTKVGKSRQIVRCRLMAPLNQTQTSTDSVSSLSPTAPTEVRELRSRGQKRGNPTPDIDLPAASQASSDGTVSPKRGRMDLNQVQSSTADQPSSSQASTDSTEASELPKRDDLSPEPEASSDKTVPPKPKRGRKPLNRTQASANDASVVDKPARPTRACASNQGKLKVPANSTTSSIVLPSDTDNVPYPRRRRCRTPPPSSSVPLDDAPLGDNNSPVSFITTASICGSPINYADPSIVPASDFFFTPASMLNNHMPFRIKEIVGIHDDGTFEKFQVLTTDNVITVVYGKVIAMHNLDMMMDYIYGKFQRARQLGNERRRR